MASAHKLFAKACEFYKAGRLDEAEALYRKVIAVDRKHFDSLYLLGLLSYQLGRHEAAAEMLGRALALQGERADVQMHLGVVLHALGRLEAAAARLERALALKPDDAEAHNNLEVVLKDQGQLERALCCYQRALALKFDYAEAHNNLGVVLHTLGRFDEAVTGYRRALALRPDWPEALTNLGRALQEQGKPAEAIERYRQALGLRPDDPEVLNNLGLALADQEKAAEAIERFRQVLRLRPDHPEALYNLGNSLQRQGGLTEAIACYQQALRVRPDYPDALNNLGNTRLDQSDPAEATACFRRALALKPDFTVAHSNILFAQNFMPGTSTAEQQRERAAWNAAHTQGLAGEPPPVRACAAGRRLRIGYVSPYFRHQAATYAFAPLVLHHDRERFEVVCYADGGREDDLTLRLRAAAETWRPTARLTDDQLAALVREDGIDILVDCVGHMKGNRLLMFARRPAPVQITAWGEPTGTGLAAMDYLFADPVLVPAAERPLFAETVIDLPCFLSYWTPEPLPEPGEPPALAGGGVRFGSFNRVAKLTDATLALWAQVLAAVPGSVLLLKDGTLSEPEQQAALRGRWSALGGENGRLELRGGSSRQAHFEAYREIDLALDPLPHGGGMTTLDALWMGVPVVTLLGAAPSSRLAAAVLSALALGDWIAASPEDYLALAARLAADLCGLRTARATLRQRMQASPVGDAQRYARAVEARYLELALVSPDNRVKDFSASESRHDRA